MRTLSKLVFVAALLGSTTAMAQETVVVDLSGITADLATALGVNVEDLPGTIAVSPEVAAAACDTPVEELSATCIAVAPTAELVAAVGDDDDGVEDGDGDGEGDGGNGNGSANSAREFAPGQQDGPARDHAPGQQDGPARDHAPGQVKRNQDNAGN